MVCEGQFDVLVETGSGPMVLCTYSAGDHANSAFGELALATGKPQAAEIVARTEGRRFIGLALTCLSEDPSRSRSQVAFLQSSLDPKAKKCTHSNKCTSHVYVLSVVACVPCVLAALQYRRHPVSAGR